VIVTVTPNLALDVTYRVGRLVPDRSHRVSDVVEVAGGKGVNVASVLHGRGVPVVAAGLAGGGTGAQIRHDLERRGIPHRLVEGAGSSRRTVTVVGHDGGATVLNEPGPTVGEADWDRLLTVVRGLAPTADVLVASGSLPPGAPVDGYAHIVRAGHDAGCQVVLDASGPALVHALPARPDVIKPNRDELVGATGHEDVRAGVQSLQRKGARDVLVSLGGDGMALVPREGQALFAELDRPLTGNPTGAGDAAVAAVAAGLLGRRPWPQILLDATAWSAAAVLHPVAGHVDDAHVEQLRGRVRIRPHPHWSTAC
jgi:1-phosphofructokinase family hexose kinase